MKETAREVGVEKHIRPKVTKKLSKEPSLKKAEKSNLQKLKEQPHAGAPYNK